MLIRLFAIIIFLIPSLAYSQVVEKQEDIIKFNTNLVVLDAQVIDQKTNKTISGLQKENFILYDENTLEEITFFKEESLPLSIIFLFEVSKTLSPLLEKLRPEEWPITKYIRAEDEVAIMAYGSQTQLVQDFTKDRRTVIKQITKLPEIPGKLIFQREAIFQAAQQMKRAKNPVGRRAIIVITSNFSTEPLLTNGNLATKEETLEQLYQVGATVTGLIFGSFGNKLATELSVRQTPDQILISKLFSKSSISIFASETGGEVNTTNKENFLEKMNAQIEHLRTRYSLAFTPSVSTSETFRKISLKLNKINNEDINEDIKIRTRQGYYPNKSTFINYNQLILPKVILPANFTSPYKVINLMPRFWQIYEQVKNKDIKEQTKELYEIFIKQYPDIFNANNLGVSQANFESEINAKLTIFLFDLKKHILKLQKISNQIVNNFEVNEENFLSRFPDFRWKGTIYFVPILTSFISKQTIINNEQALIFGLDSIAFKNDQNINFWPIFHHELFHLYHQQFQVNAKHLNFEQPLYDFIWQEGLACYIASLLNPETNKGEILQLDFNDKITKISLQTVAKNLRANLNAPTKDIYQNYFGLNSKLDSNISENYVDSGNYLCFLLAEKLVLAQTFPKAIVLEKQNLEKAIDFMLRRVELSQLK
ncbi:MAG: VWA domain-containing protein [Blastocatellia bacterium]|nr:VWA domain-containing protein [Blastocatellia bacterium]